MSDDRRQESLDKGSGGMSAGFLAFIRSQPDKNSFNSVDSGYMSDSSLSSLDSVEYPQVILRKPFAAKPTSRLPRLKLWEPQAPNAEQEDLSRAPSALPETAAAVWESNASLVFMLISVVSLPLSFITFSYRMSPFPLVAVRWSSQIRWTLLGVSAGSAVLSLVIALVESGGSRIRSPASSNRNRASSARVFGSTFAFKLLASLSNSWHGLRRRFKGGRCERRSGTTATEAPAQPRATGPARQTKLESDVTRPIPRYIWIIWALNCVSWFRDLCGPRQSVRVAWTCRCGKRLRITVAQQQLKGALEFAKAAVGPSGEASIQVTPPPSPPSSFSGSDSGAGSLASSTYTSSEGSLASPASSAASAGDGDSTGLPNVPRETARFLLLCVKRGPYRIVPSSLGLTSIIHDTTMFHMIRDEYYGRKPAAGQGWSSRLRYRLEILRKSLIVPRAVEYVKFEIIHLQKTGARVGSYKTDEIPSIKQVYDMEYSYRPCPLDVGPYPIHPDIFMHWFLDPGDHADDRSMAIERLPKKLHTSFEHELGGSGAAQPPIYWGIYIIDGLNWARIQVVLLVSLLATFLVSVGWSAAKDDVQGGMSIGSTQSRSWSLA